MFLEINDLVKYYGSGESRVKVLQGITAGVEKGKICVILGSSGCGKSTLLNIVGGIEKPDGGYVSINGEKLADMSEKELTQYRRKHLGYVFQDSDSQLFMSTIYEDVAFAPRNYGKNREEVDRCVMQALQQVHLEAKKDKPIYQLSGGEKKLASIATVLAMPTKLMLLDEPSVALDPRNRRNLINVLNGLPVAKLIASHDLDFIHATCSKVVLLSQDGSVSIHPASVLLNNQALLEQQGF